MIPWGTNLETTRAMHLQPQHMMCKESAGKIVKRAEGVLDPGTGEERQGNSSSFTKTDVGTKKRVISVFEMLTDRGNKPGMIKTLEGTKLEACPEGDRAPAKPLPLCFINNEFDRKVSHVDNGDGDGSFQTPTPGLITPERARLG